MDLLRGKLMPLLLVLMALALAFLGSVSKDDAVALAQRANNVAALTNSNSVAPRAEAEARRRALLKRAHEANIQGLGLYGAAAFLAAAGAILFLSHLRMFRPISTPVKMVEVTPRKPDSPA